MKSSNNTLFGKLGFFVSLIFTSGLIAAEVTFPRVTAIANNGDKYQYYIEAYVPAITLNNWELKSSGSAPEWYGVLLGTERPDLMESYDQWLQYIPDEYREKEDEINEDLFKEVAAKSAAGLFETPDAISVTHAVYVESDNASYVLPVIYFSIVDRIPMTVADSPAGKTPAYRWSKEKEVYQVAPIDAGHPLYDFTDLYLTKILTRYEDKESELVYTLLNAIENASTQK